MIDLDAASEIAAELNRLTSTVQPGKRQFALYTAAGERVDYLASQPGPGGPHDRGMVVIDATDCVLLERVDACTMDHVRTGQLGGQVIFMTLGGRVNKTVDQVRVGYMFGTDGAATIITELLSLADRHGPEMLDDVTRRLKTLYHDKNVDLAWLRAAIDNAMEDD